MNVNGKICLLLVIDDLGYGGAERQVIELANNLDSHRFDVHVCALSDHVPLRNILREEQCRLHIINKVNRFDFTVVPRLAHLLRKLNADIVHGYLFSAEIASRIAGLLAKTRLVIGSERNANRVIRWKQRAAYRLTKSCVDYVVANSYVGAESNQRILGYPSYMYRVVHNGVDTTRFKPMNGMDIRKRLGIPSNCPTIGVFANFKRQKNHGMLFRSFYKVLKSIPEAHLVLIGDRPVDIKDKLNGYRAEIERMIDDLKIRNNCHFLGHQLDVEKIYPMCDVTVLSSLHEGTPNVLLESMACGVPVVATNVCDNEYIVKNGGVGYLVEVGDDAGMANCIEKLLRDPTRRKEMGWRAREWVQDEFSTKRLAEKMESIYLELLDAAQA